MNTIDEKKINEVLSRGVGEFIDPNNSFKDKLLKKVRGEYDKDIIVKFGVDPTSSDLHLGHAVPLRKLRQFQDLGCKVIFLIGDFTAKVGDPTGKSTTRPDVGSKEIEKNMKTYLAQVSKILRTEEAVFSWIQNSEWFTSPLDLNYPEGKKVSDIVKDGPEAILSLPANSAVGKAFIFETLLKHNKLPRSPGIVNVSINSLLWTIKNITYGRLMQRELFRERIKKGEELSINEMLYPVFQGIDSYALSRIYGSCDLEMGGTDQTFNMLMGRDVMKSNNQEPQSVCAVKLLEGTDGKDKMSKSLGNYIEIAGDSNDMYGKIMSIPDSLIVKYFELCTYTPLDDIATIERALLKKTTNPRDTKMRLAKEIVSIYHGESSAEGAQEAFVNIFQKGELPENIEAIEVTKGALLFDLLKENGLVLSKADFKRLIEAGAIHNLTTKDTVDDLERVVLEEAIFKVGKRRFLKVTVK